jgi:DNA-binding NtrC family response regulator
MNRLLIVDDDPLSREYLVEAIQSLGLRPEAVAAPQAALERLESKDYDLVLSDLRMPGMSGLELLKAITAKHPGLPVVLLTAHGSMEAAIDAVRLGAADFLLKPITPQALNLVLERVQRTRRLESENAYLRSAQDDSSPQLIARSPSMQATLESAGRIANSKGTVLITGESGSGKERIAHFIHQNSPRRSGPFVRVNCAALSESLLESELFGHERGAFTGAHKRREGRFELADGGTLLLDEIGEMSPGLQSKLLRVLEESEFERVGGSETLRVDVRVITSTNRSLPDEVQAGRFREDLYYRLHVLPIHLAPLRERQEDVLPLAEHFARHYARQHGFENPVLTAEARVLLTNWNWPGNVRELENVIQRAVVLTAGAPIDAQALIFGPGARQMRPQTQLRLLPKEGEQPTEAAQRGTLHPIAADNPLANRVLDDVEREAILSTLCSTGGNKTEAARRLGVTARTLSNKMKLWRKLGLVA